MTNLELLVCLVQQAERAGVVIEGVNPLRAAGPSGPYRDFVELIRYLREQAAAAGSTGQVDNLLRKFKERGSPWCDLGGIDWQRLSKTEWALTRHEQHLLAYCLGGQVKVNTSIPVTGRLEGVMPGRLFVTANPTELDGSAVARFLQRTNRAIPYASTIVHTL